jgi:hypothetical protein
MRFRRCMTRAMTLVRVYFVNALKAISNDINQRISAKVYLQRSHDHEEYASLLNECYQAYFGIRIRLITPIIMARMAELSGTKDIVPHVLT